VTFRVDSNISANAQAFVLARDIGIIAAIHYDVLERRRDSITLFSFSSPRIQGMELLEDDFNAKFLFNQKSNYFLANAENLNHPMPFSNKQTSKILEQQCQEHLSGTGKAVDIVSEIRCLIMESPTLSSNKAEVAARLNISVRTLARKLTAANTSWNQLLTQLKLNKAMSLLESTDLEIKEIAELVGYSSAGVLSRKLVDTLGLTALEYRRSILTKYP
jgi:AraC-like DNA-binding protein